MRVLWAEEFLGIGRAVKASCREILTVELTSSAADACRRLQASVFDAVVVARIGFPAQIAECARQRDVPIIATATDGAHVEADWFVPRPCGVSEMVEAFCYVGSNQRAQCLHAISQSLDATRDVVLELRDRALARGGTIRHDGRLSLVLGALHASIDGVQTVREGDDEPEPALRLVE